MKKEINLIYKPVADTDSEEARRRMEEAFDVLFDEIFAQKDSKVDCRLPDNLIGAYGTEVVGNG